MSKHNDGGPAFPVASYVNSDGETFESKPAGMSLRDWFAGQAIVGVMQSVVPGFVEKVVHGIDHPETLTNDNCPSQIARWCWTVANAMLAERSKANE